MTPQLWAEVERRWDAARDLSGEALERFLDAVPDPRIERELRSLLAHDETAFLGRPVDVEAVGADRWIGERPGRYRLLERIGSGGMGRVYRAERTGEFDQQVAVKILRPGADPFARQRFLTERQILADFEHPNIARLIDGGLTGDGRPYVVMECVDGLPITEHCRRHRLDLEARLRLFQQLCRAVHFAHQRLVVHRDLKPSNVLVTEDGELKLLDFGIAKLLANDEEATATRLRPLTPRYASPEQLSGEAITTASDVYSLGLLLYELLAGCHPFTARRSSPPPALDERPPRPPSAALREGGSRAGERLARQLRGDLDTIVMTAMQRWPEERYASALALSHDIDRHLASFPITARPPSLGDRLRKLVRRHRAAAAGAAVLLAVIVGLAIFAAHLARQALVERDEARLERRRTAEVAAFLEGVFQAFDPEDLKGESIRAKDLIDRQTARVRDDLGHRPELQARFLSALGRIYQNLGQLEAAQQNLELALAIRRRSFGDGDLEVAESQTDLAWLLTQRGEYTRALELLDASLAVQQGSGAGHTPLLARSFEHRGLVFLALGRMAEAEEAQRTGLDLRRRLWGERHQLVGASWRYLAEAIGYQGRFAEAIACAERALEIAVLTQGRDSLARARALATRGDQRFNLRRLEGAVADYDEALELHLQRLPERHPSVGLLLNNRARALRRSGDLERAEASYQRALAAIEHSLGPDHREIATLRHNLSLVARDRGRYGEAEAFSRSAEDLLRRQLGDDHWALGNVLSGRASILREAGRLSAAEEVYGEAIEVFERRLGEDHPELVERLEGLGRVHLEQRRFADAGAAFARALQILVKVENAAVQTSVLQLAMGDLHTARGDREEARSWYHRALDTLVSLEASAAVDGRVRALGALAENALDRGHRVEALELANRTLDLLLERRPRAEWQIARTRLLAAAAGRRHEIEDVVDALATLSRIRGAESTAVRDALRLVIRHLESRAPALAAESRRQLRTLEARRRAVDSAV